MGTGILLLLFLTAQRLIELRIANRNTARLLARGATEYGTGHYPLMVGFHSLWLAAMWIVGWTAALDLFWTSAFVVLQGVRIWILLSLGDRWTTRIIILDEPLVRRGPYRFMKHPNYALVVGEIAVVPLALGAPVLAIGFSILHFGILFIRIRAENRALEKIGGVGSEGSRNAAHAPSQN